MPYTHLTYFERCEIQFRFEKGQACRAIAQALGRSPSTVSRELRRNRMPGGRYKPLPAQVMAQARQQGGRAPVLDYEPLRRYVEEKVKEDWSPEQIAGRLPLEHPDNPRMRVSHETIYGFIYADKRAGGTLYTHLRQGHKRRHKRGTTKGRRGQIPGRVSITERPAIVDAQERIGDWEGDTLFGNNHRYPLVTLAERKTLAVTAARMPDKRAHSLNAAAQKAFKRLPGVPIHTLTVDNGKEFCAFKQLEDAIDAHIYFAEPFKATDRAINENINGLIRQYLPKGTDLSTLTERKLNEIIDKLNNRPRKKLGYRTPLEMLRLHGVAL